MYSAEEGLVGRDINFAALKELTESSRGMPAPWDVAQEQGIWSPAVPLFAVIGGGMIDGINPCMFTVIIFFTAYLSYLKKAKKEIVIAGMLFTVAVFLTYYAVGLGLLGVLKLGDRLIANFSKIIMALTALLVLVLALDP